MYQNSKGDSDVDYQPGNRQKNLYNEKEPCPDCSQDKSEKYEGVRVQSVKNGRYYKVINGAAVLSVLKDNLG